MAEEINSGRDISAALANFESLFVSNGVMTGLRIKEDVDAVLTLEEVYSGTERKLILTETIGGAKNDEPKDLFSMFRFEEGDEGEDDQYVLISNTQVAVQVTQHNTYMACAWDSLKEEMTFKDERGNVLAAMQDAYELSKGEL